MAYQEDPWKFYEGQEMIGAYKNGQYLGCDETHVGRFAWLILTPAEAAEAIAELLASQPDGWQDVEYRHDHV